MCLQTREFKGQIDNLVVWYCLLRNLQLASSKYMPIVKTGSEDRQTSRVPKYIEAYHVYFIASVLHSFQ